MSPRSKEQFEEIREASLRKIFNASLELFGTKGYETTSIAQIAKQAGISKGLIYNYFNSKEELLEAMVMDLLSIEDKIIDKAMDDDKSKTLEVIIRYIFKWLKENEKLNRLLVGLSLQIDRFEFIRKLSKNKMDGYLVMLEDILKEMNFKDYNTEARILATVFDGIAIHYIVFKEDYPLDEVEEMLLNKYCKP